MVALIEDQIHQALIDKEETRCCALEEEHFAATGKRKKVKRRVIRKPWSRNAFGGLCQESEFLLLVEDYDYALSDVEFQEYCKERGVLHVAGKAGSTRWTYYVEFSKTKDDYLDDDYFHFAEESAVGRHRYTDKKLDVHWEIIQLGRARLQDCWEVYLHQKRDQASRRP
jgi:hypothetical protein